MFPQIIKQVIWCNFIKYCQYWHSDKISFLLFLLNNSIPVLINHYTYNSNPEDHFISLPQNQWKQSYNSTFSIVILDVIQVILFVEREAKIIFVKYVLSYLYEILIYECNNFVWYGPFSCSLNGLFFVDISVCELVQVDNHKGNWFDIFILNIKYGKCICFIKSPRSRVTLCFQFVSAASA